MQGDIAIIFERKTTAHSHSLETLEILYNFLCTLRHFGYVQQVHKEGFSFSPSTSFFPFIFF